MKEIIIDTVLDSVRLIPFLFLTYLVMEYLEHKTGDMAARVVERSGRFGPLLGALLGIFPQCGFSAAGSSLYAGGVITTGTLFAIYLSTSDEMLPIMLSEAVPASVVCKILLCKVIVGACAGFLIDTLRRRHGGREEREHIGEMCGRDRCHCERGIVRSAAYHTAQVVCFLALVMFGLNLLLDFAGESVLERLFQSVGIAGELTAGLIGLIPNCAASVMITQLYLEGALNFGSMLAGLLTGSGIGLLVLFRVNPDWKENAAITFGLYLIGTACGIMANAAGLM